MNHTRLYVGDLASNVTDGDLKSLFVTVGEVDSINMMGNASHLFAFIEMKTPEAAREAVRQYNGYELQGRRLIVYTVPPQSRPRDNRN